MARSLDERSWLTRAGDAMFLLVGSQIKATAEPTGEHHCSVCSRRQLFSHVVEREYFTFFGIRLLQINTHADYLTCDACANSYVRNQMDEPSQVAVIRKVMAYIASGYGVWERFDTMSEIFTKVTGAELGQGTFDTDVRAMADGDIDVHKLMTRLATNVNAHGKRQVIEAAFLATYASCEMEYEDRLRVNLIGSALGVSLEYVESVINHVRSQGYYGVRRLLSSMQDS